MKSFSRGIYTLSDNDTNFRGYFFEKQFARSPTNIDIQQIAVYENDKEFEIFITDYDAYTQLFINSICSADWVEKLLKKDKVSIFCHFDCRPLLNYFKESNRHSIHLTYYRKDPFPVIKCNNDLTQNITFRTDYSHDVLSSFFWKLDRDFFTDFKDDYGDNILERQKKDFMEFAAESENVFAVKNNEIVGYMFSLPYYDTQLSFRYHLIGFIWLDQRSLNKEEKKFISSHFFNQLNSKEPPFGAAIHINNLKSANYFEKNGFCPYWIRLNRK